MQPLFGGSSIRGMNKLLMPFVGENDSPKFVKGFECGQIWEKMKRNEKFNEYLFHTENVKQVELICKRFLYSCRIEKIDECWSLLYAELTPKIN